MKKPRGLIVPAPPIPQPSQVVNRGLISSGYGLFGALGMWAMFPKHPAFSMHDYTGITPAIKDSFRSHFPSYPGVDFVKFASVTPSVESHRSRQR